jgi:predicted nucleotidyltransferase
MGNAPRVIVPDTEIAAFCRRWRIVTFDLFGSVLTERFGPANDVDVLVRFAPDAGHSLFDLVQMQDELEALFGRRVDLVDIKAAKASPNDLQHTLRPCSHTSTAGIETPSRAANWDRDRAS